MNEQISIWGEKLVIAPPNSITELIRACPNSAEIQATLVKCSENLEDHDKVMCSVSGGYDSDIMLDLILRCGGGEKTTFVFNDTGLEYDATKEHIYYLEEKYGIKIIRLTPKKDIPNCVREYGIPFWSKYVSGMISRLQKHGFQWKDGTFEEFLKEYPKCKAALRWRCNDYKMKNGRVSKFNIEYIRGLKEFMMHHPPQFMISAECCDWAKKRPAHDFLSKGEFDLNCVGVRKQEGGTRSTAYKSCFDRNLSEADNYRPLFWWTGQDKEAYRKYFEIIRSDCYEVWGMKRTGCAGCPFGKDFDMELDIAQHFEPKHYRAMMAVFGKSYEYTWRFLEFRKKLRIKAQSGKKTSNYMILGCGDIWT